MLGQGALFSIADDEAHGAPGQCAAGQGQGHEADLGVSLVQQVLDRLPEWVPALGKPIGFVINYSPDQAVRFDPNGQPIAILNEVVHLPKVGDFNRP